MPFGISIWELLIVLAALLLLFGASRLPEMGRSLGRGMREFKEAVTGNEDTQPAAHELPAAASEPAGRAHDEVAEESEREPVR